MGSPAWRIWSFLVQAAAFVGAANILSVLLFVVFARWPSIDQLTTVREFSPFVLAGLIIFGAVPYTLAGPRFGRWRIAALTGLMPGLLLGGCLALLTLGSESSREVMASQGIKGDKAALELFATSGSLFLFMVGMGVAGALLVRALVPADILDESRNPARPHWRDSLPLVVAASAMATIPLDEERSIAMSCFETPQSTIPVADFYLHVPEDQLKLLAKSLSSHANANGWTIHGTVRDTRDHLFFAQSVCLKPNLEVGLERDHPLSNSRLQITVYVQSADIAWQTDVRTLMLILGRAGQVTRKPGREVEAPPSWYLAMPVEPEAPATPPSAAGSTTH